MPRTLKSKWSRSYAYKRNKQQRGWQKIEDMESHHSQRNLNRNSNEISFIKFDCKFKNHKGYSGWNAYELYEAYNPACLNDKLEDYDWRKESVKEFCQRKVEQMEGCSSRNGSRVWKVYGDALKQINRRGQVSRFVTHQRRYKHFDQIN